MLEDLLGTAVHRIGHSIVNRQGRFVPLGFFYVASSASHEHQAEKSSDDKHAQNDENHRRIQGFFITNCVALEFFCRTVGPWVFTSSVVLGLEFHQAGVQARIRRICKLLLELLYVAQQIGNIPVKKIIFHVNRSRKFFSGKPFCFGRIGGLVVITSVVNGSDSERDVIHVAHAVLTGETCWAVAGQHHVLGPSGGGPRHVKVGFQKSITVASEFSAQRPLDGDDGERWGCVGQEEGRSRCLRHVSVLHVHVEVATTVVLL